MIGDGPLRNEAQALRHHGEQVDDQVVEMTISNPLPPTPRRDLPSTGTGLNRMAQRVLGVEGEFSAGIVGSNWVVRASLPIAPSKS